MRNLEILSVSLTESSIFSNYSECNGHEINKIKVPQSNKEFCGNCLRISFFKQIEGYFDKCYLDNDILDIYNKVTEREKHCKLCGKSLFQETADKYIIKQFKLCSDCYLISFEWVESTLVKKQILILYLPWWHNTLSCDLCYSLLIFTSDCQKHYVIEYRDILFNETIHGGLYFDNIANIVKTTEKYFDPVILIYSMFKKYNRVKPIRWISYSQFTDVKEMTKGGYGIIYKATLLSNNETVILKRIENSNNNNEYFLNELKSNQYFSQSIYIIEVFGYTKDPELKDYILVMSYASKGDLYKYLQKNFTIITWYEKLRILQKISMGLRYIHGNNFIHRDFHSGNILLDVYDNWKIGDLGLSQSAVNNKSSNNDIYGVIPYIAPEIFKGSAFSKESDIYSFGMIMWELTTGCKPFANVEHDIHLIYKILDGERPKITKDTPEYYVSLMKSCWDPDPKKRPSMSYIQYSFDSFYLRDNIDYNQAEAIRKKLIESKKIGPEFAEKWHSEAIYTSRPLSALISKLSTNSYSTISFGNKQDYNYNYISKEKELDIDIKSLLSQNITIQNSSISLKKRNNKELNPETQSDSVGKRIKTSIIASLKSRW
ncbi:kinase-like domain-containing protein [Rhizophagus irregularis DAOM 181602=DAOM 197198]|nr:kinase-like domain-containing protein [Rhizophagus irregularis DAOM 181602=DAOM 197198]